MRTPKRAFVTGATGGIGSSLCARLSSEGWTIVGLARETSNLESVEKLDGMSIAICDMLDPAELTRQMTGCDVVFHLAALVHAEGDVPESLFKSVNVDATQSVLSAAVAARVPAFVFFSTVAVYPTSDDVLDELSPPAPSTAYGRSKLAAERLVLESASSMRVTVLRLPVVYGPRDRGNVRRLIEAIDRGRFVIPGSGENIKTMVSVDSVVQAAMHAAEDPRAAGATFVVADERASSLAEIAGAISRALGKAHPPRRVPLGLLTAAGRLADGLRRATGVRLPLSADQIGKVAANTRYSGDRIRRELGLVFETTLEDGMASAVSGYKLDLKRSVSSGGNMRSRK